MDPELEPGAVVDGTTQRRRVRFEFFKVVEADAKNSNRGGGTD